LLPVALVVMILASVRPAPTKSVRDQPAMGARA